MEVLSWEEQAKRLQMEIAALRSKNVWLQGEIDGALHIFAVILAQLGDDGSITIPARRLFEIPLGTEIEQFESTDGGTITYRLKRRKV